MHDRDGRPGLGNTSLFSFEMPSIMGGRVVFPYSCGTAPDSHRLRLFSPGIRTMGASGVHYSIANSIQPDTGPVNVRKRLRVSQTLGKTTTSSTGIFAIGRRHLSNMLEPAPAKAPLHNIFHFYFGPPFCSVEWRDHDALHSTLSHPYVTFFAEDRLGCTAAFGFIQMALGLHAQTHRRVPAFEHLFLLWHTVTCRSTAALPKGIGDRVGTETDMPIYEYVCQDCDHQFDRLWPSVASAQDQQPVCPDCASTATQRTVSQVAVLGKLGGLTPQEQSAASTETARTASYTPKEQIQTYQANRQRKREQGK